MGESNKIGMMFNDDTLKTWMDALPEEKRNSPLIYLTIPGSHNTFSYSITPQSDVSPDSPDVVQRLSHWAKWIVNPIIYKWSRTQTVDIIEQLNCGIRYLDIRVVSRDNQLYVAHGLYGGLLIPYLLEINKFVVENQREAVVLDFQHFYKFSQDDHNALIDSLTKIFDSRLCQRTRNIATVTLNSMASNGEQIIIVYRWNGIINNPNFWPSGVLPNPWPNKLKLPNLIEYLNEELDKRNNKVGLVTQCLLTVDTAYVVKHPFENLKALAAKTNRLMLPWVQSKDTGPGGINIVICDFVKSFEFSKAIVELNYR